MPATSPDSISDRIRLAYKVRGSVLAFVSEYGAVDTAFAAAVDESAPHIHRIACFRAKDNLFARSGEEFSFATVRVLVRAVMSFIKF